MYKFSIGQKVRHIDMDEEIGFIGTITGQSDSSEIDTDMEPGCPWYQIKWEEPNEFEGQEPESQLSLV